MSCWQFGKPNDQAAESCSWCGVWLVDLPPDRVPAPLDPGRSGGVALTAGRETSPPLGCNARAKASTHRRPEVLHAPENPATRHYWMQWASGNCISEHPRFGRAPRSGEGPVASQIRNEGAAG